MGDLNQVDFSNIYIILLFIAPGLLVKEIKDYLIKEKRCEPPIHQYLFSIVVDSIIVLLATVYLINTIQLFTIGTISDLINNLESFKFIAYFVGISFCIGVLWCCAKIKWVHPLLLKIKNLILKPIKIQHTEFPSVWDSLLKKNDISGTWLVVSIYKDDTYITSGMIEEYTSSNADELEFSLEYKRDTEELMKHYPELFVVWHEYYNSTTGLRILFYEQKRIREHWDGLIETQNPIS